MPRYYEGDNVTVEFEVTENGLLTDPATVSAEYREGRQGDIFPLTPNRDGVGLYSVVVPITKGGVAYHVKAVTTGPDRAVRRHILVGRNVFDTSDRRDYPVV